jgi:hypothetical protein
LGENLAWAYDSTLSSYSGNFLKYIPKINFSLYFNKGEKATLQWYSEIKDHNFNGDNQKGTGIYS